ncbi:MAG: hypothetical protein RR654_09470, partial [Oscillospiraceae bacterium]
VEFSVEDIDEKLKAANNKLKEDIAALEKLNVEKQNANLEHINKINDLQSAGITGYADKTRGLENKKSAEQKALADKKLKLEQIKTEITNLQAEKDGAAAKLKCRIYKANRNAETRYIGGSFTGNNGA